MLPFTKEKLYINNQNIFYYDRQSQNEDVADFSNAVHQDLKDYLGIQREIRQREKTSKMITNDQKKFDEIKIFRIEMFYDYYIDQILLMMQMLYYENYFRINEKDQNYFRINERDEYYFLDLFNQIKHSGLQLKQCFEKALKICEDIKLMIEKQIKIEYPIETFSDKFVKK